MLANTKSAKRFLIKSKTQRKYNMSNRSMLRTFIKKINIAINNKDKTTALSVFPTMQKIIDRQTLKGLIHRNRAARYKSKIFKRIKSITL